MGQVVTTLCVERGGDDDYCEYELTIVGDVEPYIPANLSGHPDNWTPPEGGSSCVESVLVEVNGVLKRWTGKLTAEEETGAEQALYDQFEDYEPEPDYDDYHEVWDDARADYVYDPWQGH